MKCLFIISCLILFNSSKAQTRLLDCKFPVDSGYFSSFDGTKIYYEVRGEGKPVLLVHGFIVDGSSWKRTALYTDLLNNGYQVVILDMRGNGRSGKPHDSTAYDNDAEAKDIMLLMNLLKTNQYSVVGYSRGSIITARLLVLDKRIHAAVLGGMGIGFTNPQWPRRIMFYRALMGHLVPELKGMVNYVQHQKLDQLALAYLQRSQPSTSKKELSKITQPVLVISGNKDTADGSTAELARLLPNSALENCSGDHNDVAGTTEFAKDIIRFLQNNHY